MPASTPIARSKTAALARITDSIPKGYHRYTTGTVLPEKAEKMILKLHQRHAIGATPAQRLTRKKHGKANALLAVWWPEGATLVHWCLLFTSGELDATEMLSEVTGKARLVWLRYELVRHPTRGGVSWTWKRTKEEMEEHYLLLNNALRKRHYKAVGEHLTRIANQPGFYGVRQQSWELCQHAKNRGYPGDLPYLFYLEKVSHGERLVLA